MKRKLGFKNGISFLIIISLFITIIIIFAYFINYELKKKDNIYEVASSSILFDYKNNYIELKKGGTLKKGFDNNYYLNFIEDGVNYKQKIGKNTLVYKDGDYKLYYYGNAYVISKTGEVKKISGKTEIMKADSPYFLKISDRKYLFVDKKIGTEDGTIKTSQYLIIELDKQGNANFLNFENDVKTIKPIILKGTLFDFDIANEKLIIDKDNQIDLKKIIGSTNQYVKKTEEDNKDKDKDKNTYYDDYLTTIKNSFNNLTGSVNGMNDNIQKELAKDEAYLDLTRWTTVKSLYPSVNSIKVNYSVFDPNNEFSEIFIIVKKGLETQKIQLSKTNQSYIIPDLIPDTEYNISFGYRLVKAVGDSTIDVITDSLNVKTSSLNYKVEISKITTSKIYFKITFNNDYIPNSCDLSLYSGDILVETKIIKQSLIDKSGIYTGFFNITTLDYMVSLKLHNIIYDSKLIDYTAYAKFVS
ncbi:MAG: hypothetical protein RR659_05480 [Bacilli bacterium]